MSCARVAGGRGLPYDAPAGGRDRTAARARPTPEVPARVDERLHTVMNELATLGSPENRAGMARYGINVSQAFGVSVVELRTIAKRLGTDHELALGLWETGNHEARILAAMVDDPAQVSGEQLEAWVSAFDSWDLCDQVCSNLFDRTSAAYAKAAEWAGRDEEFVKRAGFALMAALSVHDKAADEAAFLAFLPLVEREAGDERPYVKKAVNWALRQIGKRDRALNRAAIATAERVRAQGSRSARWIASDALRELLSDKVQQRLEGGRGRTATLVATPGALGPHCRSTTGGVSLPRGDTPWRPLLSRGRERATASGDVAGGVSWPYRCREAPWADAGSHGSSVASRGCVPIAARCSRWPSPSWLRSSCSMSLYPAIPSPASISCR